MVNQPGWNLRKVCYKCLLANFERKVQRRLYYLKFKLRCLAHGVLGKGKLRECGLLCGCRGSLSAVGRILHCYSLGKKIQLNHLQAVHDLSQLCVQ